MIFNIKSYYIFLMVYLVFVLALNRKTLILFLLFLVCVELDIQLIQLFYMKMLYQIQFKPKAIKDLKKITSSERDKIIGKIELLSDNLTGDVKKLTNFSEKYRFRVGNYRVLFNIEYDTITIYRILHRREVYKK